MAALVRGLSHAFVATSSAEVQALKVIAMLVGGGALVVSLLMMTYGVDLSPGFF